MYNGVLVLKNTAILIIAIVFAAQSCTCCTYYAAIKNVIARKPFPSLRTEDCDYIPISCRLKTNKQEIYTEQSYSSKNVWNLVKKLRDEHPEKLQYMYAVFMASSNEKMKNLMQGCGSDKNSAVYYSYHVVLVYLKDKKSWVYDFDSTLQFQIDLKSYFKKTFRFEEFPEEFQPVFRVIKAKTYLETFDPARDDGSSLYVKMKPGQPSSERYGEVLDRFQFIKRFS